MFLVPNKLWRHDGVSARWSAIHRGASRRSEFAGLVGGITFTGGGMMMNRTQGVFLMVLLIQLAMVTTGLAQSTSPGWEPIEEERLLNPEDGDWMNYRLTNDVT